MFILCSSRVLLSHIIRKTKTLGSQKQFYYRYNRSSSLDNLGSGETSTSSDDDMDSYRRFGTNSDQNISSSSSKKRRHKKKYRKHRQSTSLKNVEEMIGMND